MTLADSSAVGEAVRIVGPLMPLTGPEAADEEAILSGISGPLIPVDEGVGSFSLPGNVR